MELSLYQVDAFSSFVFKGNPAAVVPLTEWLPDTLMQSIAEENNLAETAFFVKETEGFRIRWFTPVAEVDLCGHATLASAHVMYKHLGYSEPRIFFQSNSGPLYVSQENDLLQLNFPSQPPVTVDRNALLEEALEVPIQHVLASEDYLVVVESQRLLEAIKPDFRKLANLEKHGVIVTAPGSELDFVARFFAPKYRIDEDPVTGSAYTQLTPYWAAQTGKTLFSAAQLSTRGGLLECELKDDRVHIRGKAITYLIGKIFV